MEVTNLNFSFENKPLFQDLNLKIQPEQLTMLLGPSGCGKSTLLRLFAGLINSNSFFINDFQKASFVFQDSNLLGWLTCEKNIMLPIKISKSKINIDFFNRLIERLKIKDCLHKYPHQISGGQKMRISIARALVTEPQILFLDEPFSALDEPTRMQLQDELLELQKELKMTILFVTHSFFEAAYLADRVLIFSNTKPTVIIQDFYMKKNFLSRYEEAYLNQVQHLASLFESNT